MNKRIHGLLLLIVCTSSASARTLVVDNVAGSDLQNDRGLVAGAATYGPYRTIARALMGARPGDTISLVKNDEPYRECVSLSGRNHSGTESFPFRIAGNGSTLDGSVSCDFMRWEHTAREIYRYTDPRHGFAQLMQGGRSLPQFMGFDLSQMSERQWAHRDGYLYFRPQQGKSPVDHKLEVTTEAVGISLFDVEHVVIENLVVRGYRQDGINAHDKANYVQLIGIASRHNGRSGFSIGGSSTVLIGASLSELNGRAQLRTEGQSFTELINVDLPEGDVVTIDDQGGTVKKLERN